MDDIAPDVDIQAELEAAGSEQEAAPAPAPEVPQEAPRVDKQVPLAALLEERNKWKSEVEELKSTVSKGNERLEKLMAALQGNDQKPAPPQFEQDPLGHLKYGTETTLQELQQIKQWKEQQEQTFQQQQQMKQFYDAVALREQEFAAKQPDYMEAAKFVRDFEKGRLELLGFQGDQLSQALEQQMATMAAAALRSGRNPAEAAYEFAKRAGYKAQQKQDIATLQRGSEAAKTVPSGSGEPTLTLEALASMSDDDFESLVDDKNWGKLRGR